MTLSSTLAKAAYDGDLEGVQRFLAAGVDPNEGTSGGDPCFPDGHSPAIALHAAAAAGHDEILRELLEAGAQVDLRDGAYRTALMHAVEYGDGSCVRRLLAAGADVKLADEQGATALHAVAEHGDTRIATLLLEAGA